MAKVPYLPQAPGGWRWLAAVIAAAVLVPSLAAGLDWTIETVDSGKQFSHMTDRSLRLDGSYHPHIVYGGDHLYHSWYDGAIWHYETVDNSPCVGKYASLALEVSGYAHIAYYDESARNLKYAYQDGSGWHTETLDASADVGLYTSVDLDGMGRPHVSYYDATNRDLKYAYQDVSGWHIEAVESQGDVGGFTSLALDADGYPHISYHDAEYQNEKLKYAQKNALGWHIEVVVSGGSDTYYYTSLALDGFGFPRISYRGSLRYAHRDASGWHTEQVEGGYSLWSSLALDAQSYPHITHIAGPLKYAYKDGSGWHTEAVDAARQYPTSLCLDASGCPNVSYCGDDDGGLKYAFAGAREIPLWASLQSGQLVMTWAPFPPTVEYWVYGAANQAYFEPGFAPGYQHRLAVLPSLFYTWSTGNGLGDPDSNWTYLVLAIDAYGQEMCRSNRVGEQDLSTALSDPTSSAVTDSLLRAPGRPTTKGKTEDKLSHCEAHGSAQPKRSGAGPAEPLAKTGVIGKLGMS